MKKAIFLTSLSALALGLAGCQQAEAPPEVSEMAETSEVLAAPKLPVSINAAMVGLIDHSADYIFAVGNGDMPRDDHDWDLVRSATYDMILGGTVIQIEGTGEYDAQWVANDEWRVISDELTAIGQEALVLADAKSTDVEAWRGVGDKLVANCLTCHEMFKPESPVRRYSPRVHRAGIARDQHLRLKRPEGEFQTCDMGLAAIRRPHQRSTA